MLNARSWFEKIRATGGRTPIEEADKGSCDRSTWFLEGNHDQDYRGSGSPEVTAVGSYPTLGAWACSRSRRCELISRTWAAVSGPNLRSTIFK